MGTSQENSWVLEISHKVVNHKVVNHKVVRLSSIGMEQAATVP